MKNYYQERNHSSFSIANCKFIMTAVLSDIKLFCINFILVPSLIKFPCLIKTLKMKSDKSSSSKRIHNENFLHWRFRLYDGNVHKITFTL